MIVKKIAWILLIIIGLFFTILGIIGGGYGNRNSFQVVGSGEPLIFAHRGTANYFIENSLESFQHSKKVGFKAIETDINFTKDQKLVVFHDRSCSRLLGIKGDINELNWKEIEGKHLLFNEVPSQNTILSLDDFFEYIDPSIVLYLDIKHNVSRPLADSLIKSLERNKRFENTLIANGDGFFLAYLKYKNPMVKTALEGFFYGKGWLHYLIPKNLKPDYYASFLNENNDKHLRFLKRRKLMDKKIVFDVHYKNLDQAIDWGFKHMIIDYDSSTINTQKLTFLQGKMID